jgi:hypothetical protein
MDMTMVNTNKMSVGIIRKQTRGRPGNRGKDGFK